MGGGLPESVPLATITILAFSLPCSSIMASQGALIGSQSHPNFEDGSVYSQPWTT